MEQLPGNGRSGKTASLAAVDWLLAVFGKRKSKAVEGYKAFVAEGRGQPSPWLVLKNQIYLGSDAFVEHMQSAIEADKDLSEIPASQRRAVPKPLAFYAGRTKDRDTAIKLAYDSGGYSMREIGEHFGLHYSRISKILRGEEKRKTLRPQSQ